MALEVERVGDVNVIRLSGKIVTDAAREMKTEFDAYEVGGCDTLVDMKDVDYMSSYLIGILVACYKRASAAGRRFELAGVSSRLRLVLTVSALDSIFRCHASREDGIRSLESERR